MDKRPRQLGCDTLTTNSSAWVNVEGCFCLSLQRVCVEIGEATLRIPPHGRQAPSCFFLTSMYEIAARAYEGLCGRTQGSVHC